MKNHGVEVRVRGEIKGGGANNQGKTVYIQIYTFAGRYIVLDGIFDQLLHLRNTSVTMNNVCAPNMTNIWSVYLPKVNIKKLFMLVDFITLYCHCI